MGLDTVELVFAFEDEFGITIKDEDTEHLTTPAAVTDYIMARVHTRVDESCPSQVGFYRIRSILVQAFGIPRNQISPQTLWSQLFASDLQTQWRKLRQEINVARFPQLQRTRAFLLSMVFFIPALLALLGIRVGLSWPISLIVFLILVLLANSVTSKFGTLIPKGYETVSALIPFVACGNDVVWVREEALAKIITITSVQLGIPPEKIHADSRFVQDLGAD